MRPDSRRTAAPRSGGGRIEAADPARHAAACLLRRVLDGQVPLDEAMQREPAFARLEGRDRGFAARLAMATLRALGPVEHALSARITRPLPDNAGMARALLRTGAAQILEDLAPVHAAVGQAVALAKADPSSASYAGLINAVLRGLARDPPPPCPLSARWPAAWSARWRAAHGQEALAELAAALARPPPLDLSTRLDADAAALLAERLGARLLPGGTLRLDPAPGDPTALSGWAEGWIWAQDAAAALPARLLGVAPGLTALDLCAAPGGKTLQMAAAGGRVVAVDADPGRLARLNENLARTGLSARVLAGDGRTMAGALAAESGGFDRVLVDAPCSATGTLRRHPEAPWIKDPAKAGRLAGLQAELVAAGARALKPGGLLVYAVCSLEPEEAWSGLEAAARAGLVPDPVRPEEAPGLEAAINAEGHVRTWPGQWPESGGLDGFFIARFRKPD